MYTERIAQDNSINDTLSSNTKKRPTVVSWLMKPDIIRFHVDKTNM